jgi:hypothetical protein
MGFVTTNQKDTKDFADHMGKAGFKSTSGIYSQAAPVGHHEGVLLFVTL